MKSVIAILLLTLTFTINAQEVRVGLMGDLRISELKAETFQGGYTIFIDTIEVGLLTTMYFKCRGGKIQFDYNDSIITADIVRITPHLANSAFKLKAISPVSKDHFYRGSLELLAKPNNSISVVNVVPMNDYLAGVIESEGGGGRNLEYYKVQALMSRTYVLRNLKRHEKDGYEVCDRVHCQAYHNMLRHTPAIEEAVTATNGEVLVDAHGELVTAYFSANCGGQTCEPSYVWNNSISYLQTFKDTFCIHTRQAQWKTSVAKSNWKSFLESEYGIYEKDLGEDLYNFNQEQRRAFYIHPSLGIPLRDLRAKFKLKSTYFSTYLEGDRVIIEGRGFGHGVGLCQEGAMQMAKYGYNYRQISRFYFTGVRITAFSKLVEPN